jgi:multimeric flavodoxin WrbA
MQILYAKFREYHRLVLAAPIYFMAHCAQAKIIIDRCQALWSVKYVLKKPLLEEEPEHERIGAFVSCGGTKGKKVFAGAKVTMKYFYDVLQMEYAENLLFNEIDAKGDILKHPTAMEEARELGTRIGRPWKRSS